LFFLLGLGVLLLSIILIFVLHMRTRVTISGILLQSVWRSRKVEIRFSEIVSVKKIRFKETLVSHPAYNHYLKGKLRFYSRGNTAVELTRRDGLIYRIGSQRTDELLKIVKGAIRKYSDK
jgi:hypothetical protein